jgi:uncharacterized membrane protein YjjP (DUF1212 family)
MHIGLLFYSVGLVFSKLASQYYFVSIGFLLSIMMMSLMLATFAIIWQQVLKRVLLTTALLNAEVCLLWSALFGSLFFKEIITIKIIFGISLIVTGVFIVNRSDTN